MDESTKTNRQSHLAAAKTLVLSRGQIAGLMTTRDYLAAAEEAFRALATGRAEAPPPLHIPANAGAFHAKGARLQTAERTYAAVKINGNFPMNPERNGRPTIQGAIVLSDADNGAVLAIMDSIEVTAQRTAAATALAAGLLARPNAATLAICGCGEQARAHLAALASEFKLHRVFAWDRDRRASETFARVATSYVGFEVEPVDTLRAATRDADIIVTCTTARSAFLGLDDVAPGTFIAAVGADNHDKSEIAPALMARAKVVVDVRNQCAAIGDLHHAIAAGVMTTADVHASLGELVIEQRPARTSDAEITIFDSTGTAAQDVAAAARIYERATAQGIGTLIALNA